MRGVLEAVGVRANGRVWSRRSASARWLLLGAALVSLALGLAVRELAGTRAASPPAPGTHVLPARAMATLPTALRGPVSAAMGADDPSYHVTTGSAGGLTARTPAARLSTTFGAAGVTVASAGQHLSLGLRAVGFGAALAPVAPVAPRGQANRVVFSHAGLSEWYLNGPLGLEQGFTIGHAPAGTQGGALTLALNLSSSAPARLAPGHKGFTVGGSGPGSIAYTGLSAVDAAGRVLPSRLQISGGQLLISVDAGGASYPVKVDPFVEQAALTGTGASGNARFGASVALSADGNTALVGGWRDNNEEGAAWVFTRSGETWTQQGAKLTGSGETGPKGRFGASVALSDDGNTALIGGYGDSASAGAAWVFTRSAGSWTQQGAKLTGSGETGAGRFGMSVALSDSGNTALIGANRDSVDSGAAFVFTRSVETWTQQGSKLTGSGESGEGGFGTSVALSGEGNTALIGAPGDNSVGAAFAFVRSEGVWAQQGSKLTGSGGVKFPEFGASVALSDDGNTALIGGSNDNGGVGAAWPFTRSGEVWSQQGGKLLASDEAGDGRFGESVALSSNGNAAIIGGSGDHGESGAIWSFARSGTNWVQSGPKVLGGEGSEEEVGDSVAISASGTTVLAGARFAHSGVGTAYVYQTGPHSPSVVTGLASSVGPTSATLEATVNPNGEEVTECKFEWGTTVSYENSLPCSSSPGAGEAPVEVSASLSGLTTGQHYHFRISATNITGTAHGNDREFTPELGVAPTVTKISAKKGPASGGTSVVITGTGFGAPFTVDFGSVQATTTTLNSPTSITVLAPPNTSGTVPVTVTTSTGGTSAPNSKAEFKYENPKVTSVTPAHGPLAGGTSVTVTGSGFALGSGTKLLFKTTPGTAVSCPSSSECTVTSPATTAKPKNGVVVVDVVAEIGKAKSKKSKPADTFTYE